MFKRLHFSSPDIPNMKHTALSSSLSPPRTRRVLQMSLMIQMCVCVCVCVYVCECVWRLS